MLIIEKIKPTKRRKKIPDYLIYEVMDGKPIYRKGYKQVLNKQKIPKEIIGISSLQATVMKVDIEANTENFANDFECYFKKLWGFQIEKVTGIFTYAKKVIVSEPNKPWITLNWTDTIEMMLEIQFSIQTLIDKTGFTVQNS